MRGAVACLAILGAALTTPVSEPRRARIDDQSEVMDVIERQAATFWAKDFDGWADTWVHAEYVRRVGWSPSGGAISVQGWNAIGTAMKKAMADNPAPNPTPAKLVRDHVNLRTYGDVAWLTFDQHAAPTGDTRFDMPGVSHETRILERHDGKWKLVYVGYVLAG